MPGPIKSVFIPINTVLAEMIANLGATTSPITDFTEGSATRTILEAFAIVVSNQSSVADQLQLDSYLATATEESLDAQGENWQVPRLPSVQASGKVKITRESSSGSLIIPAGWGQLTVPPSTPGTEGVALLTTENAEFANGVSSVEVAGQAVLGGTAGNLTAGTVLTPINPITGVNSTTGYTIGTNFTGGVNVETDEAYRARIPLVVQARGAKGTKVAFEAAVLSVPGVESVGVEPAGYVGSDGVTIPEGKVQIVYEGSTGLLSAVTTAAEEAATLNQKVTVLAGASLTAPRGSQRFVLEATAYYFAGANTAKLKTELVTAALAYVNSIPINGVLLQALVVEAMRKAVPEIASIALPLTKLNVFPSTGAVDTAFKADQFPHLAEGDCVITMTEVP